MPNRSKRLPSSTPPKKPTASPRLRHTPSATTRALERCHERWVNLFFGLQSALIRHDPNIAVALEEAYTRWHLFDPPRRAFASGLFDLCPSDATLKRTRTWRTQARLPSSLRGKTRAATDSKFLLFCYYGLYQLLKTLPTPRTVRNPTHRVLAIEERLQHARQNIPGFPARSVQKRLLTRWIDEHLTNRQLTRSVIAHLFDIKNPNTVTRLLTTAKQSFPRSVLRRWEQEGIRFIQSP